MPRINWHDYYILIQDNLKSEDVKGQVEIMIGEADIRRDKGCNFVVEDDVEVEEDSHWSFQEKESNYEPNTVDHSLEDIESKDVQNAADEVDIRIDKDKYDGSGDDMEIEEDNHQIYQKEEHNLQTYAEDNGLTNICKLTVALECSEVSAFEVNLYIKSFHFIYSLILLLKTYKTSVTSIFCKNCLHFLSFDNFVLRCGKCLGISFLLPSFVNHCWLMTK